jgi:hypothetical protein
MFACFRPGPSRVRCLVGLVSRVLNVVDTPIMLSIISTISQHVRPWFWQSGACASLVLGRASFSRTHPAAITSARREHESEEARAARLARQKEYYKARREKETDEAREARLIRKRRTNKTHRGKETDEAREARLTRMREYNKAYREHETVERRQERLARRALREREKFAKETDEQRQERLALKAQRARERCAKETAEQRQQRLARRRQIYAEAPEKQAARQRASRRKPDIRARNNEKQKQLRHEGFTRTREQSPHEKLSTRRATKLQQYVFHTPWRKETWTWKAHTPISYHDRVDHHCTACDEIRFLKHWWKERLHPDAMDTDSGQDRYMCNHCFANDFNLMVPENCSDIPRLSRLFTSLDFPPPFRRERLKAQASAVEIKDEHEKEHEEEH